MNMSEGIMSDLSEEFVSEAQLDNDEFDQDPTIAKVSLSSDGVKDYLRNIGKTPLLDAQQEIELSIDIEVGLMATQKINELRALDEAEQDLGLIRELTTIEQQGKRSFDHLVSANLRLVVSLAKRYTGQGLDFLDLIQEGNTGLIRAVEKFDYTKGFKFSTYATWWIRQSISRAIADQGRIIRIPVHTVEDMNKLSRIRSAMLTDLGRDATEEEIAREMEMTPEKVADLIKIGRLPVSLNIKLGNDSDTEYGDLIADDTAPDPSGSSEHHEFKRKVDQLVGGLTEQEAEVIRRRFGLGVEREALDAIAQVFGISRGRIRNIEA